MFTVRSTAADDIGNNALSTQSVSVRIVEPLTVQPVVVEARGGICLGCHINLPPQMFNELQRYREVRQCPSCHRIVFWRMASEGTL